MPAMKRKFPRVGLAALHGVFDSAVGRRAAILRGGALGERPGSCSNFLKRSQKLEALGALERMVILQEGHAHHEIGESLAARRVGDGGDGLS